MRGVIPPPASGIEYHERHTITPDGVLPERFGKPLEIPEDLEPIPDMPCPTAIRAGHPMAKYVKVYEVLQPGQTPEHGDYDLPSGRKRRALRDAAYFDAEAGVVVEFDSMLSNVDPFGVYPERARTGLTLQVEWDQSAIAEENDRRLRKAMECGGYYARVIDAHQERIERERIKRENDALAAIATADAQKENESHE